MKLSISHVHDVIGHRITVEVDAEQAETIQYVKTDMDGFPLAEEYFDTPQVQYNRIFPQVGGITPGMDHVVQLTATNDKDVDNAATAEWTD